MKQVEVTVIVGNIVSVRQLAEVSARLPLTTRTAGTDEMPARDVDLEGLLQRVDAALGDDGQLL